MTSREERTCYVTDFHEDVTEDLLKELFIQIGPVESIMFRKAPGKPFALVTFVDEESVPFAIETLDEIRLFDRAITVRPKQGSDQEDKYKKWISSRVKLPTPDSNHRQAHTATTRRQGLAPPPFVPWTPPGMTIPSALMSIPGMLPPPPMPPVFNAPHSDPMPRRSYGSEDRTYMSTMAGYAPQPVEPPRRNDRNDYSTPTSRDVRSERYRTDDRDRNRYDDRQRSDDRDRRGSGDRNRRYDRYEPYNTPPSNGYGRQQSSGGRRW